MKRNSKAALKSVPKSQNGIVIAQTGTKTYSTAAAAGPSKVNRSLPNGTGVTGDGAAGDALPLVKLNRKNGSVMNCDPGEGTVLDESKVYVAGNGVLDPRKRNGISVGNGQEGKPGKQTERQTNHADAERWMQGPVSIGVGDPVTPSSSAVMDRTPDRPAVMARNNEPRKFVAENKGISTDGVQRQNAHELRPVKILQRPASVAKCQTPEKNPEHDLFSSGGSPQERRHREKCLSLNTEEREHLENLIENLIISCVDNEDDSSGDETGGPDLAPRMMRHDANPRQNVDHGRSPGKAEGYAHRASSGGSSASKTEREARSETPRSMGGRIEAGGKGRKFVRETSGNKNAGRGRDQGKRREISKVKDNRKTGDFQPTRPPNEEMRQPPPQQDNLQERQDMMSADVYPAQLKVAIKHMDALPPRFLRRIQNGKGGIGGSEPTLPMDDRSETPTPPEADLRASSSTGKDLDKLRLSKKQGVKNMIRNLLNNMDDDESTDQQSESCARTLDFALGAIGERREIKVTDSLVRDAFLSGGSQSSDVNVDNTPMTTSLALFSNGFDSFQHRTGMFGQQQHPADGFPPQGSGSQALNPTADFRNYQPYAGAEWRSAYNGYPTTANNSKKVSFSVNAPEFVSKLYEPNPSADTNNSARDNDVNANLLRYCGVNANDGMLNNHLNSQDQLVSGIPRNNLVQPEYYGTLRSYAPFSGNIPVAARDASGAAYPNQDASFSNEAVTGHGPGNADLVQSMRLMQYGGRGYLQPTHHQMQMIHQQQQQRLAQQQQQQLQQLSQQQQLLNQQQQQQLLTQQQQQLLLSQQQQQQQQQQLLSQQQQLLAQQMLPTSQLNQPLVGGGMRLPVTGNPTSLPWFPGNQGSVYSTTVMPSQNALPLQPMPFDVGRQMLMRLMNEGKHVMVILVGRVDDNKLSLISELQTNVSGTLVLNLRNGMCHNNDEKEMEFHRWNYKQALEATQLQKNPIIIDHTYAQPWQMKDYIGLAQMNKYLVQIIDCDETRQYRAIPNAGSYGRDDPLFQSAMEYNNMPADKDDAIAGDVNRCNIPGVENNTSSSNSSQLSTSPPLPVALSFPGEADGAPGGGVALAQKL